MSVIRGVVTALCPSYETEWVAKLSVNTLNQLTHRRPVRCLEG